MPIEEKNPHLDLPPSKGPTLASSIGRALVVILLSGVTFLLVFWGGAVVGTRVSAAGGYVNEHHMGHGVMTGIVTGTVCSLAVAVFLYRRLFRSREQG